MTMAPLGVVELRSGLQRCALTIRREQAENVVAA